LGQSWFCENYITILVSKKMIFKTPYYYTL
jgi:hypothetical protein